jgi:hypothetical protein
METARFLDHLAAKRLRLSQHPLHIGRAARVDVDQPLKRCPQSRRLVKAGEPISRLRLHSIVLHCPTIHPVSHDGRGNLIIGIGSFVIEMRSSNRCSITEG